MPLDPQTPLPTHLLVITPEAYEEFRAARHAAGLPVPPPPISGEAAILPLLPLIVSALPMLVSAFQQMGTGIYNIVHAVRGTPGNTAEQQAALDALDARLAVTAQHVADLPVFEV